MIDENPTDKIPPTNTPKNAIKDAVINPFIFACLEVNPKIHRSSNSADFCRQICPTSMISKNNTINKQNENIPTKISDTLLKARVYNR